MVAHKAGIFPYHSFHTELTYDPSRGEPMHRGRMLGSKELSRFWSAVVFVVDVGVFHAGNWAVACVFDMCKF